MQLILLVRSDLTDFIIITTRLAPCGESDKDRAPEPEGKCEGPFSQGAEAIKAPPKDQVCFTHLATRPEAFFWHF